MKGLFQKSCQSMVLLILAGCSVKPAKDPVTMSQVEAILDIAVESQKESSQVTGNKPNLQQVNDALLTDNPKSTPQKTGAEEPRFDLEVDEVPARSFFMGLVKGTPYSMLVHPTVQGTITLSMQDVTVKEVLDAVNNIYGYEYQTTSQGFEVMPMTLQTRVYNLNYLFMTRSGSSSLAVNSADISSGGSGGSGSSNSSNASSGSSGSGSSGSSSGSGGASDVSTNFKQDIWTEVTDILKTIIGTQQDGRSLSVSPQSGVIIVRAMPAELKRVDQFLSKVQKSINKQVILEAKVLEVQLADGYEAGINWGAISGRFQFAQGGGGDAVAGIGRGAVATPTAKKSTATDVNPKGPPTQANFNAGSAFGGLISMAVTNAHFSTFLEFLNTQGNVQVLSNPRVATLNNQKAIIKVGTDNYYVTSVSSNTSNVSGAANTSQNIGLSQFFSGIALDVTPFVDEDDSITLHVHPSITDVKQSNLAIVLNGQNQSLPLASSSVRESDTVIRAHNGQMVIIGGLMTSNTSESVASIPWFGKIPFFGTLFRQTKQDKSKTELVILLRPIIVDQNKWADSMHGLQQELQSLDRGFHWGGRTEMFGTVRETNDTP